MALSYCRTTGRAEHWSSPYSPDTLTFMNKALSVRDIGIRLLVLDALFKLFGRTLSQAAASV